MNLFNCFQAVGFFCLLPWGAKWLHDQQHTGFFWVAVVVWFIGYVMVSLAINESEFLKD